MIESVPLLDIRTLSIVLIFIAAFFGVALIGFAQLISRFAGIRRIGTGLFCISLAFTLIAARDVAPPLLSVVAANLVLTLAWALLYQGMTEFRDVPPVLGWLAPVALVAVAVVFPYYTFVAPNVPMRVVWIGVVSALQVVALIHATFAGTAERKFTFGQWAIGGPLALFAAYMILRSIASLGETRLTNLLQGGAVHGFAFLLMTLTAATITCGLLWLAFDRMEHEMRAQTRTDPLTGALNRRAMDEVSISEVSRSQRTGSPVSVLIADLDNFKVINDEHGHLVGDEVLRQFAALLAANVRSHDALVRYGGEEFLILLPETDREEAAATAEKLRVLTETQDFRVEALRVQLRASFGVATLEHPDDDWTQLLRRTDAALYEAKNTGRNRVSFAWDPPRTKVAGLAPATS